MKALQRLLLTSGLLSMFGTAAFAQEQLAVINQAGQVWARDLTTTTVGPGYELKGLPLANDQFGVLAQINTIYEVNKLGQVWAHSVDLDSIGNGELFPGSLFGGPDALYVLPGYFFGSDGAYVVNSKGEVWAHPGFGSAGYKLNGNSIFGGPNTKYVLFDQNGGVPEVWSRILVVNTVGQVWAHDLSCSVVPPPPAFTCNIDTIGNGYLLSGPSLFGAPNDKYVVEANNLLLVINTSGQVWARTISASNVGAGYLLTGPTLFGAPNDKYVVAYEYLSPPQ